MCLIVCYGQKVHQKKCLSRTKLHIFFVLLMIFGVFYAHYFRKRVFKKIITRHP